MEELNMGHIFTHKSCVCNEQVALAQRHQIDDGSRFNSKTNLKQYLRPLIKTTTAVSEDYIISRADSSKRKLLQCASLSLRTKPLGDSDGHIKMFLKDDKYHHAPELAHFLGMEDEPKYTAPRCIQYRNKRYCLRLATHLHPIEENTYAYKDWTDTQVFAKGLNLKQRAEALSTKWQSFVRPKALLLDHSKFDAHISLPLLRLERWYYNQCSGEEEMDYLMSLQINNKGRTKNETRYKTKATRMSGDQNTGLGNSIINYAMLCAFCEHYDLKYSLLVDGDDSVIVIEDEGKPYDLSFFAQFGMKTLGEEVTTFSQVEFCQTKPVQLENGWTMVRNPYRMILRLPWTTKVLSTKGVKPYLASVGRCELALGMGAPIGQYFGHKLSELSSRHVTTSLEWVAKQQLFRPRRAHLVPPTHSARESYYEAWGISPEDQIKIETSGISMEVDLAVSHEERPFD